MNTRNGAVGIGRTRGTCRGGDGLHPGLRSEQSEGPGRRVILGVTPEGRNERVVIGDGYRESKESWKDIWLDLNARGLQAGPWRATGDGAMGLGAAWEV